MTNELERANLIQTAFLATISVAAAVGLWSGLADYAPVTGVVAVPAVWLVFTGLLLLSSRIAVQRGYEAGVAGAQVDAITRLPSSAVVRRLLAVEFGAAERGRPLTIVCFSIDDYAQLAATHEPLELRRLLVGVGTMLRRRTRDMNMSCRYGDDGTFLSVLGGIPGTGGLNFAGKVCKDFGSLRIAGKPVTVSTSVCTYDNTIQSVDELLAKGLRAMAEARRKGAIHLVVDGDDGLGEREGYAVLVR
jgi:GGDEF domain-containing protein